MTNSLGQYWRAVRQPRYSLPFALPLLMLYELLAFSLSGDATSGLRNGADVLVKTLFLALGGGRGLSLFAILLFGVGAWLALADRRRAGPLEPRWFLGMMAESIVYASLLGGTTALLTSLILSGGLPLAVSAAGVQLDLLTQITISLGAGIYEELVFRVLLISGIGLLLRGVLGWHSRSSLLAAAIISALIFSAFHYVGPYGDSLELGSFTFRVVAGLLLSGLYLWRGLGITAWTHACYDIGLAILGSF